MAPRSRPAGALSFARRSAATPSLGERCFQRFSLPPAADKVDVVDFDRERRLQGASAPRPCVDTTTVPQPGVLDRQSVAFDAPIDSSNVDLLGRGRANGDGKSAPLGKIGDRDRHRT